MNVKIGDKQINYLKEGSSDLNVLFVHEWGGSISSLKPVYNMLKKEFSCVILDLPGFGESSNPDPEWGIEEYSNFLDQFIQKLNLSNLCYVGYSFGGALGVYLAAEKSGLLSKLVLISPSYKQEGKKLDFEKTFSGYEKTKSQIKPLRKIFHKLFYRGSEVLKFPELQDNYKKIANRDLTNLVPRIKQETLIIWGDEDTYVDISDAYYLKENIPSSDILIYPEFGHDFPKVAPISVYRDIREFLTR